MAYVKTNWVNGETPINDTNLNHIENGITSLETDIEDVETRLKSKNMLWEESNGVSPENTTINLSDNIYNYRFVVVEAQWGIKFTIPIIEGNAYFNGGMLFPAGGGNGIYTAGLLANITDNGNAISITYLRSLSHDVSSNHGTFNYPKLYKIIGIL